jgi:hypothetical protein
MTSFKKKKFHLSVGPFFKFSDTIPLIRKKLLKIKKIPFLNPKRTVYHGAHRGPGWGKTRPHYWPIAADWWGQNWKYPVYKESCVYDALPRYRGRQFQEHAQIGAAPTVQLGRAREKARLRTRCPPHSTRPATGNWLECWLAPHRTVDHRPAGLLPFSGGL